MDNINFTGAFLIKNPTPRVWRNIEKFLPKRKIVFQQFGDEQDKFIIVKDCYDKQVADAILLGFAPRSESFAFATTLQFAQFPRYPDSFHSVRPQIRRTQKSILIAIRNK